jgi:tRNA A-37 threonylcarbamoyl transferase component Bud32
MNPASDDSARDDQLEAILHAYLQAVDAGQVPDRDDLLRQHPEFASELAAFFADQDAVAQMARGMVGVEAPAPAGTRLRYFGDYELLEEIARGGMGVVYKARQVSLNREVALKMILAGQLATTEDVQRFRREAESAANLDHPNIVPIFEVGVHGGQHYFGMKLINGQSLASCKTPLEARKAAAVLAVVARAVHHAHLRGILHRDLKPGNIIVDAQGQPYVTDFGLAKRVAGDSRHTRTGSIVGTPSYMPPEQARSEKMLTTAADVYSLGAILFELLTGQPPFRAETPLDTVLQVLEREPEPPRKLNQRIEPDLETICLKCLEKEPGKRYGSAEALAEDLEHWLRGEPIRARPGSALERVAKWVMRQRAAGPWAVGILASLAAVMALTGANALVSGLLLAVCWFGVALYFLRQQSQLRGDEELRDAEVKGTLPQVVHAEVGTSWTADICLAMLASGLLFGFLEPLVSALLEPLIMDLIGVSFASWMVGRALCLAPLFGGMLYLFRRETLRHAVAKSGATVTAASVQHFRFRTSVLMGTGFSLLWVGIVSRPLWQAAGYVEGMRYPTLLFGAMIGALLGACTRALRPQIAKPILWACAAILAVSVLSEQDWRLVRPHGLRSIFDDAAGSGFVGPVYLCSFLLYLIAMLLFAVFGPKSLRGEMWRLLAIGGLRLPAVILGALGATVFLATLFGRVGMALAGGPGQVCGEWLGAFLAGALSAVIFPCGLLWDIPPTLPQRIYWKRAFLLFGTGSVGILWFIFADDCTGIELRRMETAPGKRLGLAFSPDGRFAISVSANPDVAVQLWNVDAGNVERSLEGSTENLTASFVFSADGSKVLAGSTDGILHVWEVATSKELRRIALVPYDPKDRAAPLAVSPDGQLAALAGRGLPLVAEVTTRLPPFAVKVIPEDNTIKIRSLSTGAQIGSLTGHTDLVASAVFSPDGRRLLSGSFDGTMRLWDVSKQEEVRGFQRHSGWVTCVAFCPDGRHAIAGYYDWSIRLWDLENGQELRRFAGQRAPITSLAVSPDGWSFLSGSLDSTIRLWDLDGGAQRCVFRGQQFAVTTVTFCNEGRRVACWDMIGTMRMWQLP